MVSCVVVNVTYVVLYGFWTLFTATTIYLFFQNGSTSDAHLTPALRAKKNLIINGSVVATMSVLLLLLATVTRDGDFIFSQCHRSVATLSIAAVAAVALAIVIIIVGRKGFSIENLKKTE